MSTREKLIAEADYSSASAVVIFEAMAEETSVSMPHMDGEETFCELRRLDPGARVILSSGYAEQDVVSRFAGKGLSGFIQKPYTLDNLRTTLSQVMSAVKSEGAGHRGRAGAYEVR